MALHISIRKFAKQAAENGDLVFMAPYCTLKHMLCNVPKLFYNNGIYGWNCDIYLISPASDTHSNVWIVTGCRHLTGDTIPGIYTWDKMALHADEYGNLRQVQQAFVECLRKTKGRTQNHER